MRSRNTTSGAGLEDTILPVLLRNGYQVATQQIIGTTLGGGRHRIDALVTTPLAIKVLVSVKWQQVSGTAKEKVPFEVIKLIHAVKNSNGEYLYAYLVLAGTGWGTLRDFYLNGGLSEYIAGADLVRLISLEKFMALANRQQL